MPKLVTRRRWPAFWSCLLSVGCSAILDIDGHYVHAQKGSGGHAADTAVRTIDAGPNETGGAAEGGAGGAATGGTEAESGGASTGGMLVAGGASSGGVPGSGGVLGTTGAVCTGDDCEPGLKCCGIESSPTKACYAPAPLVGCGESGCEHCTDPDPVPTHATAACAATKCSFICDPGFTEQNGKCVATGTGGTGAGGANTGGRAGASGCTKDAECPKGCGPAGPLGCCMVQGICGCTYFNIELGGARPIDLGYCFPRPF